MECRATHAYIAASTEELSFAAGAIIRIIDSTGEWWLGELSSGHIGIVPSNHLEEVLPHDDDDAFSDDDDDASSEDEESVSIEISPRARACANAVVASDSIATARGVLLHAAHLGADADEPELLAMALEAMRARIKLAAKAGEKSSWSATVQRRVLVFVRVLLNHCSFRSALARCDGASAALVGLLNAIGTDATAELAPLVRLVLEPPVVPPPPQPAARSSPPPPPPPHGTPPPLTLAHPSLGDPEWSSKLVRAATMVQRDALALSLSALDLVAPSSAAAWTAHRSALAQSGTRVRQSACSLILARASAAERAAVIGAVAAAAVAAERGGNLHLAAALADALCNPAVTRLGDSWRQVSPPRWLDARAAIALRSEAASMDARHQRRDVSVPFVPALRRVCAKACARHRVRGADECVDKAHDWSVYAQRAEALEPWCALLGAERAPPYAVRRASLVLDVLLPPTTAEEGKAAPAELLTVRRRADSLETPPSSEIAAARFARSEACESDATLHFERADALRSLRVAAAASASRIAALQSQTQPPHTSAAQLARLTHATASRIYAALLRPDASCFVGSCIDSPLPTQLHGAARAVRGATQRVLVAPVYDALLEGFAAQEHARDAAAWSAGEALRSRQGDDVEGWIALQALCDVPPEGRSPDGWAEATIVLRSMEDAATPFDAAEALLRARALIVAGLARLEIPSRKVGADLMLPILVAVTVRARLRRPWTMLRALREFTPNDEPFAQHIVTLAAWEVALEVVEGI